jgi:tetratricopeptide (TPR) repeat protein
MVDCRALLVMCFMRLVTLSLLGFAAILSPADLLAAPQEQDQLDEVRRILHQASELVETIPEPNQSSAAINIAGQQARSGDLQGALATAHLLKNPRLQAQAFGSIASVMDYVGNLDGALSLVNSSIEGQSKNNSYATLANAHAARGDIEGALRISRLILHDPNQLVQALTFIASEQWKSGDRSGALGVLNNAAAIAEQARKEQPFLATLFMGIAHIQSEMGETSAAASTMSHFSDIIHQSRDPASKTNFLPSLAMGLTGIGDLVGALSVLNELPPSTNRDVPLMSLSRQLAESGNMPDALEIVSRISDAHMKAVGLQEIAEVQEDSGNTVAVVETLALIPDMSKRATALASLALTQAEKGDAAAGNTVQLAWEAANKSAATPTHVFEFIAVTRALLGDHTGAIEGIQHLEPDARQWPLWNITTWMSEAGNSAGALILAESENSPLPKAYALIGTASGMLNRLRAKAKEHSPRD